MENIAFVNLDDKKLKLTIVQSRNGRYKVLEDVENFYDLTKDVIVNALFSPQTKKDLLKILEVYRQTIESYGVSRMVAYASSVIVKARNYRGYLDEIYTNTGINFAILGEDEAARFSYVAAMNRVDLSRGYIISVGAYNTNIVRFNRRSIVEGFTIGCGFANMSQNDGSAEDKIALVKKEIKKCGVLKNFESDAVIGCGTTFVDVARLGKKLARYPLALDNNFELTSSHLQKVNEFAGSLDAQMVKKVKGLTSDGACSINGGLAILNACYECFGIEKVTVCDGSVLDGEILSNIGSTAEKYTELLQNTLDGLYEFKKDDVTINRQVQEMAIMLFKQLKVVHKLPRAYVKALKTAAFLFDCGKFVGFENNSRHAQYFIMNSRIAGLTQKDLLISAFACSCQNLDNFNLAEVTRYKGILSDDDVDAIRKIGVLVHLAASLNASRKNVITDLVCDILGDTIIMKTVVSSDASFEIMESMKVADDFRKVFKKSLQII